MYNKILFKIPLRPRVSNLKTTNIIPILYPFRLKRPLKIKTDVRYLYPLSLSYYNGIQLFSCAWFVSTERNNKISKKRAKDRVSSYWNFCLRGLTNAREKYVSVLKLFTQRKWSNSQWLWWYCSFPRILCFPKPLFLPGFLNTMLDLGLVFFVGKKRTAFSSIEQK